MPFSSFLFVSTILMAVLIAYIHVARRFQIVDKPNERSSHDYEPVRGGGIVFPIAALLWAALTNTHNYSLLTGLLLVALISFVDDTRPLPFWLRLIGHIAAIALLLHSIGLSPSDPLLYALLFICTVGWLNTFNFMDGINGITSLYSLSVILPLSYLTTTLSTPLTHLCSVLAIACAVFSIFNVRKKAICFAGDVGAIGLAFVLAFLILQVILELHWAFSLFVAVYAVDSVGTIIERMIKKQKIFAAHRLHLYQLLANEYQWPHVVVSSIYMLTQALLNVMLIIVWMKKPELLGWVGVPMFSVIVAFYVYIKVVRFRVFE